MRTGHWCPKLVSMPLPWCATTYPTLGAGSRRATPSRNLAGLTFSGDVPVRYPAMLDSTAPLIRHRHKLMVERTQLAPCAVCLAGESRSLIFAPLRKNQQRNLLLPLRADVFLVLSPPSHGKPNGFSSPDDLARWPTHLSQIERQLEPVSVVVARDEQMLNALSRLLPPGELHRITDCVRSQAATQRVLNEKPR